MATSTKRKKEVVPWETSDTIDHGEIIKRNQLKWFEQAFAEWHKRFKTTPDGFTWTKEDLKKLSSKEFGKESASYFISILKEQAKERVSKWINRK